MDIKELREKLNAVDDELVAAFEKRMELAKQIAAYKRENNVSVSDRTREREIINRVTEMVPPELATYAGSLYNTLFDLSKTYQNSLIRSDSKLTRDIAAALERTGEQFPERAVVACQGTEGAYSQFACDRLFKYPSIMYTDNFEGVFRAVDRGLCRYGILPLENSTAGSVTAVYELMQKYHFYIVASTRLFVGHVLLANAGASLSGIKEIFSHEQAINQCSDFLQTLKGVTVTVCENTATAAKAVAASGRTDAAAICSPECAELYNLRQLSDHIANTANNYTRFICISKYVEIYPGANRTSIMARLAHKPGSLYNVIARFAALGINLTKLESRPVAGSDFEFAFYFDIDASIYSKELAELIIQLENEIPELCYLGSYNEI